MRVLLAHPGPGYSVADVYAGWEEALRAAGLDTYVFNLDDRLLFYDHAFLAQDDGTFTKALDDKSAVNLAMNGLAAALFKLRPHILISVFSLFTDTSILDMARWTGTKVVLLHTESPYEDGRQLELAPHASLNLINDPTNIESFRAIAPTEYVPHAYRPSVHYPPATVDRDGPDLFFVGTGFPSRIKFFQEMDIDGLDVQLAGNWVGLSDCQESKLFNCLINEPAVCMDNHEAASWYRAAKCGINFYRREAEHLEAYKEFGWSMGPREVEQAACGLFFLRDPRPEGDEVFPMLPTFDTPEDASEKLRWWLAHDRERENVGELAYKAIEDRTFDANVSTMMRKLGF